MKKILFISACLIFFSQNGMASQLNTNSLRSTNTLFYANQIDYDDQLKHITAIGNVEIHKQDASLYCDRLVYKQLEKKVFAYGNVRLIDNDGNVIFFEQAEISDDMKNAAIDNISMILADDAKVTASHAVRKDGNKSLLDNVIYSPCLICKKDADYDPVWQIEADKVYWDEEKETIEYRNALLKLKGIPVMYTPYLNHPAPNVKRKSGIVAPSFGGGGGLGAMLSVPYFWAIDESKDLTITPGIIGSRPILGLEYRQRFSHGRMAIETSAMHDSRAAKKSGANEKLPSNFRGHIKVDSMFNLNDHWRAGIQGERTTDQTYLRKFNISGSSSSMLTSRGFLEGFYGPNYATIETYDFQGLREQDINSQTPMILPMVETSMRGKTGYMNSFWTFDSHASAIHRRIGSDVSKLSTTGGFVLPVQTEWGGIITSEAKLRGDVYTYTDASMDVSPIGTKNATTARALPWFSSVIQWPWMKSDGKTRLIIEPIAGIVAAPMRQDDNRFPNEDSKSAELNDLNIFSSSRFAGLDRIDAGSRLNYGFNFATHNSSYGNGSLFIGQSYGFHEPNQNLKGSGLDKRASDYVARLKMSYKDWVEFSARSLFDRSTLNSNRQEVNTSFGAPIAKANITYTNLPKITLDKNDKKSEQLGLGFSSQVTKEWIIDIHNTRTLGSGGGSLSHGIGATYSDECFAVRISADKASFSDRDINPGVVFFVRLSFKNLGDIQQGKAF